MWRCLRAPALALACVLLPAPALADVAEIRSVALVVAPGGALVASELEGTVSAYLAGEDATVSSVEEALPPGPYERVREAMAEIAAREGADLVVWCRPGSADSHVLFLLHAVGESALIRRVELEPQSIPSLRRTLATVLRTVVETGMLATAGGEEPQPAVEAATGGAGAPPGGEPSSTREAEVAEEEGRSEPSQAPEREPEEEEPPQDGSPGRSPDPAAEPTPARPAEREAPTTVAVALTYGLRIGQGPASFHQTAAAVLGVGFLRWGTAEVRARLGPPAAIPSVSHGEVWHGAASGTLGAAFPLSAVTLAVVAGVDVEWLWGEVDLEEGGQRAAFDHVGVGVVLRGVARVSLYRGLELRVAVEGVVRPERRLFLVRGVPTLGSGHVELGVELGLGWRFS